MAAMKTAMVICEGMADQPSDDLEGRTPMEMARCPVATGWAVTGEGGLMTAARETETWRSEMQLARLLGWPESVARNVWRGPLEALGAEVAVQPDEWIFRADFVTMDEAVLSQAALPHMSREETETLAESVAAAFAADGLTVSVLAPGRVALRVPAELAGGRHSVAPFGCEGVALREVWPSKRKRPFELDLIERAGAVLRGHPVNEVRVDLGENPANGLWPWGGGPALLPGQGRSASSAVPTVVATRSLMARGLAKWGGMAIVDLATPWPDRAGHRPPFKIAGLVQALRECDHLAVYIESRMPGGRYGKASDKVWAMECLDHHVLRPLQALMEASRPYRLALCVDGVAAAASGRMAVQGLPVMVTGEGIEPDHVGHWDEKACAGGRLGKVKPEDIFDRLRKE